MNANEIWRRLEVMGAATEYILLVPKERDVPDLRREGGYNLVGPMTDGSSARTNAARNAQTHFTDLDEACREITTRAQRIVDHRRRYQA